MYSFIAPKNIYLRLTRRYIFDKSLQHLTDCKTAFKITVNFHCTKFNKYRKYNKKA